MNRTGSQSTSKSSKSAKPPVQDAITILTQDHRDVEKMFGEFEKLGEGDTQKKKKLADQICQELNLHMAVEEELFYPTVKDEVKSSDDLVNEAIVEHAGAKDLMKQISSMKGDEELFDSKVLVLKELIEHHVEEEEDEMFPKVRKSSLDLEAIGDDIAAMKQKSQNRSAKKQ
jgi:hemerythrin superfamily protein